mmetsp:Transcript_6428/g.11010  ORF Transcript_6428/g.11010 Transcript_6428/m.11010 type:complete len:194 (-) Transcript_6428:309-890(-)
MVWHKQTVLPAGIDVVGVPGGFSYGDYLRCGAIAAQSPIMAAVMAFAGKGGHVLGVCNGFQVLCETRILPGVLMRNSGIKFVCRPEQLVVATAASPFTEAYSAGDKITVPVAHHDGNYQIDDAGLDALRSEDRIAFTYGDNPNGSRADIAGVLSANRRVLGMMPHPERAVDAAHGGTDGAALFASLASALVAA